MHFRFIILYMNLKAHLEDNGMSVCIPLPRSPERPPLPRFPERPPLPRFPERSYAPPPPPISPELFRTP